MKKFCFLIFLFSIFLFDFNVYARYDDAFQDETGEEETGIGGSIYITEGDYELTCIYSDGAELTITRDDIYITNASNSINASSNSGVKFYLTQDQQAIKDANGKIITSHADKLLSGIQCPTNLYLYKVPQGKDPNAGDDPALDDVFNYYYSTKTGIAESVAGTTTNKHWYCLGFCSTTTVNATEITDAKITLLSEEVNLTTSKSATICDYQTVGSNSIGSQTASLYIYPNASFLEVGNRITTLTGTYEDCPAKLTEDEIAKDNPDKKYLAINDPTPRVVGNVLSGNYEYSSIRFKAVVGNANSSDCTEENNNTACTIYQHIGTRSGAPDNLNDMDVCKLLGNETLNTLKIIVSWLQILVPALVIVLIGIDITKMVLSGNIEEELPKKKKSIIIRLIIMLIFFFAPMIAGVILDLLNESGVIKIGDIECFFR